MHNDWGWFTTDTAFSNRPAPEPSTPYGTGPAEGQPWPNWTGYEWKDMTYVAPPAPVVVAPPIVVDPCEWLLDTAPFTDRLEPYKFQIDTHTDPFIQYFNRDLSRRKYVDLKDPRVAVALNYMAGHTIAGIGTIATPIFNDAFVSGVLTTPTIAKENFALRKAFFS